MQSKSNSIEDHNIMVKVTIPIRWRLEDTILFDKLQKESETQFISCKHVEVGEYLDGPTLRLVGAGAWLEEYCDSADEQNIVTSALGHCLCSSRTDGERDLRIPVSWIGRIDPIKGGDDA